MYNIDINPGFGIPNFFGVHDNKVKIVFDPQKKYFTNELNNDRKTYEKLFLVVCEPKILHDIEKDILNYGDVFDKIFSPYESVKNKFNNAEIFPFGSCWVLTDEKNQLIQFEKDYTNNFKIEDKNFKLSFIKSDKNFLPGHQLRNRISYILSNNFNFDILYPKLRINTKLELFTDSMFHLCIENCQQENYFTEKIIDCFMSYTVPIYWGCPNIGDFFDLNGVIMVNSEEEIKDVLNNITEETYLNKLESIKKNYQICVDKKYAFFFDRIKHLIEKC